jgi:hypothetical protein
MMPDRPVASAAPRRRGYVPMRNAMGVKSEPFGDSSRLRRLARDPYSLDDVALPAIPYRTGRTIYVCPKILFCPHVPAI